MDGRLHRPVGVNRLLSIVRIVEIAVILGSAVALAVPPVQQHLKVREAGWGVHVLMGIGYINWRMDFGLACPPDAAAVVRHVGCGRAEDPWGTPYQLHCAEGTGFTAFSAGPDRVAGTGDDVYLDRSRVW
jgi:hypothetical protein